MIRMLQQETRGFPRLIDSNVISSWRFDGDSSDSIGSNGGLTSVNTYTPFAIGDGKDFNTSNSYVSINNNIDLSFTNGTNDIDGGFSTIIDFSNISGTQFLACKRHGSTGSIQKEWQIFYNGTTNVVGFFIFDNISGGYISINHTFTPIISQKYHLVCGYDGSGLHSGLTMFLDGVSVGTTSLTGTYVKTYNYSNNFYLGTNSWDKTLYHKGIGDEYKKWKIALTLEEAQFLATQELNGNRIVG